MVWELIPNFEGEGSVRPSGSLSSWPMKRPTFETVTLPSILEILLDLVEADFNAIEAAVARLTPA